MQEEAGGRLFQILCTAVNKPKTGKPTHENENEGIFIGDSQLNVNKPKNNCIWPQKCICKQFQVIIELQFFHVRSKNVILFVATKAQTIVYCEKLLLRKLMFCFDNSCQKLTLNHTKNCKMWLAQKIVKPSLFSLKSPNIVTPEYL